MVDAEVMEDAKHPLSLFIDNELEAQVQCHCPLGTLASYHTVWKET